MIVWWIHSQRQRVLKGHYCWWLQKVKHVLDYCIAEKTQRKLFSKSLCGSPAMWAEFYKCAMPILNSPLLWHSMYSWSYSLALFHKHQVFPFVNFTETNKFHKNGGGSLAAHVGNCTTFFQSAFHRSQEGQICGPRATRAPQRCFRAASELFSWAETYCFDVNNEFVTPCVRHVQSFHVKF